MYYKSPTFREEGLEKGMARLKHSSGDVSFQKVGVLGQEPGDAICHRARIVFYPEADFKVFGAKKSFKCLECNLLKEG